MPINYGSIDRSKRKPREKSLIDHNAPEDETRGTPAGLERRLEQLAYQNRAPSVAKAAAAELLERKAPRKQVQEAGLTASEANRICDIYEQHFQACPKCGYVANQEGS